MFLYEGLINMNLSVAIIYDELKTLFPEVELSGENGWLNEFTLPAPLFYGGEQSFRRHRVYVVAPTELPKHPYLAGECLFICNAPLPEAYRQRKIAVLTVSGNCPLITVYNAVATIFEKYASWDEAMQGLILKSAPLTDYLECSSPIISNPMILYDSNYRYIAHTGADMLPEQYRYINEQEYADSIPIVLEDEMINALCDSKEILYLRKPNIDGEHLALNLFDGNIVVGLLVVSNHCHPFRAQEPSLIRHLAKYMETALRYAAYSGRNINQLKVTMLDLLGGKQYSDGEMRHIKKLLTFRQTNKRFYCLAVVNRLPNNFTSKHLAYQLELAMPEAVAVPFESLIVVLLCDMPMQTWDGFSAKVGAVLSKLSMQAGCSDAFEDFFALTDYFKEAVTALTMGRVHEEDQPLYLFKDYALEHFFQFGCSAIPARLLCADCITRLAERDKKAAVSYCESLRVYLGTCRNVAETARRLNIQRNTFLARLERIMRFIDLDLDDPDERLYVEMSLRLLKM